MSLGPRYESDHLQVLLKIFGLLNEALGPDAFADGTSTVPFSEQCVIIGFRGMHGPYRMSALAVIVAVIRIRSKNQEDAVIAHEDLYVDFIALKGVGNNDVVASSQASYLSYLRGVSDLVKADITPELLRNEDDIIGILDQLQGQRAANTLRNYRSAMRQYVAMVQEHHL